MARMKIDGDLCIECGICEPECAWNAIQVNPKYYISVGDSPFMVKGVNVTINYTACVDDFSCMDVCPTGAIYDSQAVPPGTGEGGGGAPAPAPVTPQITDNLTGKAKCINSLLTEKGNSFVQNLFSKFEGTSKFDIAISSADVVVGKKNGVEREINGRTLMPKGKLIEIEISTSRVNARAPIEVARIILHEYIHADIYRKLGTVLATNVENLDFKTTYEKYEGEQHSVMAKLYVDSMKESLKQFHQSLFPGDISAYTAYYGEAPNDAFYEALAWGGLRDEDVKAWNELSAAKKASIESLASRVERFSKTSPCSN